VTLITSNWWKLRHDIYLSGGYLSQEVAMFKVSVVVFALAVSGFMLWIAHENTNFAQLPHATFIKRAV